MRGLLDTVLKVAVIVSVALGATSVSYYYVFYLPSRDAALDVQRQAERAAAKAESDRQAAAREAAQAEKEQREVIERAELERHKANARSRYDICMHQTSVNYSSDWDGYCKRKEELRQQNYRSCLDGADGKSFCDRTYGQPLPVHDCTLPSAVADGLNSQFERGKSRCLQEFQSGLE
jgi:hypothetical protein